MTTDDDLIQFAAKMLGVEIRKTPSGEWRHDPDIVGENFNPLASWDWMGKGIEKLLSQSPNVIVEIDVESVELANYIDEVYSKVTASDKLFPHAFALAIEQLGDP